MLHKLRVLFASVCVISFVSLFSLQIEIFGEKSSSRNFQDYCFFGTENTLPRNYSEDAIKRDILSKLPTNLRAEIEKNLRKTEIVYRNEWGWALGESACPFQVLLN